MQKHTQTHGKCNPNILPTHLQTFGGQDKNNLKELSLTFGHKKVEHCDDNSVSTEHVVPTRLDA